MLRFIEIGREIIGNPQVKNAQKIISVKNLYEGLYWHLGLSMVSIGLFFDYVQNIASVRSHGLFLIGIIIVTIFGCFSRGILSKGSPEVISVHDRDWLFGITIPNVISLTVLIFTFAKLIIK